MMTGGQLLPAVGCSGQTGATRSAAGSAKSLRMKLPPLSSGRSRSLAASPKKAKKAAKKKNSGSHSLVDGNNNAAAELAESLSSSKSRNFRSKSRSSAASASTTKSCPAVSGCNNCANNQEAGKNRANRSPDNYSSSDNVVLKRRNTAVNKHEYKASSSTDSMPNGRSDYVPDDQNGASYKVPPVVKRRDSLNEGLVRRCNRIMRVDGEDTIMARYQISSCLGQGNFAVVSRVVDNDDQSVWAMKEVEVAQLHGAAYCIENESALMFLCSHVNVVRLREVFLTPSTYYLIMEAVDNGDLFDAIKREGPFSEPMVASMVHDAASALKYLHKKQIVHRDVKPENLLLTGDYRLKLADFGLACVVRGPLLRVCGTPTYVAPEVLAETANCTGYGLPVDVWSLGVIMHILFCGYAPFRSTDREKLFDQIKAGALQFENEPLWQDVSTGAKRLLRRLLQVDAGRRLTAKKLLTSKWLKAQKCRLRPGSNYDTSSHLDLVLCAGERHASDASTAGDD